MTGDEFRRRIVQAVNLIHDELGLDRTISSNRSLEVNQDFNEVALNKCSTYSEIYRSAVSLSYYNVMLEDFALLQFSWDSDESWRLAYFPNPWISGSEDAKNKFMEWEALEALGRLDQEAITSLLDELPYTGAIPPIRFEYARSQYKEIAHPVAHFHIGRHTENRWALARPLDPLTFTMMIVRMYYGNSWTSNSSYHGVQTDTCLEARFVAELNRLRLVHDFTDFERRSLHFTSQ